MVVAGLDLPLSTAFMASSTLLLAMTLDPLRAATRESLSFPWLRQAMALLSELKLKKEEFAGRLLGVSCAPTAALSKGFKRLSACEWTPILLLLSRVHGLAHRICDIESVSDVFRYFFERKKKERDGLKLEERQDVKAREQGGGKGKSRS